LKSVAAPTSNTLWVRHVLVKRMVLILAAKLGVFLLFLVPWSRCQHSHHNESGRRSRTIHTLSSELSFLVDL
jgi:hypothetical protein